MLERTKRISFRIFSVSSKVESEPDLLTGSGSDQNVPAPAPQHCWAYSIIMDRAGCREEQFLDFYYQSMLTGCWRSPTGLCASCPGLWTTRPLRSWTWRPGSRGAGHSGSSSPAATVLTTRWASKSIWFQNQCCWAEIICLINIDCTKSQIKGCQDELKLISSTIYTYSLTLFYYCYKV